jgi:zinc D-Ala-D-Ala carboxypeptidase
MAWASKYFSIEEMRCKCGCGRADMDPTFMQRLDDLRQTFGSPLIVASAFRCPKHNAAVSSTGETGPHTTGHAVDFRIDRGAAFRLLALVMRNPVFTGVGLQQKGAGRFLHIDDLPNAAGQPRPTLWSY